MPKVKIPKETHKRLNPSRKLVTPARKDEKNEGTVHNLIKDLEKIYKANRNPDNAVSMKKYLRDQFEFFGLNYPLRRSLDKEVLTKNSFNFNLDHLHQLLKLLWLKPQREFQSFGLEYATKNLKTLQGENSETCMKSLMVVKHLLMTKSWWDTVDMLAIKVVGGMVLSFPSELKLVMDEWINDDNMWIRRTAILHQLSYKTKTDSDRLFRYCLKRCHEKEFFIQKAIGWALREYARTDRQEVKTFVNKNKHQMAPLSIREAMKHIS